MATQIRGRLSKAIRCSSELPRYKPLPQCRFYSSNHSEAGEPSSARTSTHSNSGKNTERQGQPEESDTSKSSFREAKTVAQSDEELREKLESMCGAGGEAALELENGKPVTMKRGVRENMFRLI